MILFLGQLIFKKKNIIIAYQFVVVHEHLAVLAPVFKVGLPFPTVHLT